jgi:hypothetical protein
MRRFQLSIALWAIGFIGCATGGQINPVSAGVSLPVVTSQAFSAMIVPRFVNFADSWTPTEEEVLLAEPKVQACLLSQRRGLRSTLSRYVRHYSGWTVNGARTLRVQFFDTRHFRAEELTHSSEVVDGDGQTYFVVSFNLESGECSF